MSNPSVTVAIKDVQSGLRLWPLWIALAREDIGDQHRRTILGPAWLLVNYLMFAGVFILLFDRGHGILNYPAHVAIGLLVWFFIMELLTQSVTLFIREESYIKGTRLPYSVYVMRLTLQTAMRAGYGLIGCVFILLLSGVNISWYWLVSLLGMCLNLIAAPPVILLLALLGVYLPDSRFVVANLTRLGLFVTPIFWVYDGSNGAKGILYLWNPFTYFIEIVRAPIVLSAVPWRAWAVCLVLSALLWGAALVSFTRLRRNIVFVL